MMMQLSTSSLRLSSRRFFCVVVLLFGFSILLFFPQNSLAAVVDESSSSSYVSSQFKAPNIHTDTTIANQWKKDDKELWSYVESHVPVILDHTGSSAFDEHLRGVQAVLRYWNSPTYLTNAGLFHSIYGTEGFQGFALPLSERSIIQNLIGVKSEQLCFWFCMVDRSTLDETVFAWKSPVHDDTKFKLRARPEVGRFDMILSKDEWLDFVELTLADWLEQVEGAATKSNPIFLWNVGEAYSYRRLAYRKMSHMLSIERPERLSTIPKEMLEKVMSTESAKTRHLVQPRTPPMSNASAFALEALRAVGEDIPVDLSPQPMDMMVEEQEL